MKNVHFREKTRDRDFLFTIDLLIGCLFRLTKGFHFKAARLASTAGLSYCSEPWHNEVKSFYRLHSMTGLTDHGRPLEPLY